MRVTVPNPQYEYRECYACGAAATNQQDQQFSGNWHANRHTKAPQIILNYLCQKCYDHFLGYHERYAKAKQQFENNQVEMTTCACGCGKTFPKYNRFGNEKKYYWASHVINDVKQSMFKRKVFIQCRCGCGGFTRHYLDHGRQTFYYINGHYARTIKDDGNRTITLNCANPIDQRHNMLRLYGYLKKNGCVVNDAICKNAKKFFLVPLDGNHYNIDIENYVVLCNSHKLLKARRKLTTMAELQAIRHNFYNAMQGKRKKRIWYDIPKLPEIEMRKVLSQEQGDFRRT